MAHLRLEIKMVLREGKLSLSCHVNPSDSNPSNLQFFAVSVKDPSGVPIGLR